ncbi:DUF1826 domain-containing protein [Salinicola rhizosphaerae]|uniref:DUF1826 domain-containing protein n=1 Tax=Salinicola rhizosphaerae TaxID=1443141 RepID=A0ABQ3DWP0_9GAMM|nr:DUF1826 domain-containing protein [Salinicola rhizosphaerae]GHB18612.1 hypothetical protein GCM10009038_17060 [Salinicola rhizosphaerae]
MSATSLATSNRPSSAVDDLAARHGNAGPAHWIIGDTLDRLPHIFDDDMTLSVMRRPLSDEIAASVDSVMGSPRSLEWSWRGAPDEAMRADLARELKAPEEDALVADVCLLVEAIAYLFEATQIGVRLRKLDGAMCPRFHVDNLGVRFITTYAGPGTEWLPDDAADRRGLGAAVSAPRIPTSRTSCAMPGAFSGCRAATWR